MEAKREEDYKVLAEIKATLEANLPHIVERLNKIENNLVDYPLIKDKINRLDKWFIGMVVMLISILLSVVGKFTWEMLHR